MPVRFQLVIDCTDPDRLARFWAGALGYELAPTPAGFATWNDFYRAVGVAEEDLVDGADRISDPDGHGPGVWFHVVEEAKAVKNRIHLDLATDSAAHQAAEVADHLDEEPPHDSLVGLVGEVECFSPLGGGLGHVVGDDGPALVGEVQPDDAPVGLVRRVHLEFRDPHQEPRAGERRLVVLVVADRVAGVLAQEALNALAELL